MNNIIIVIILLLLLLLLSSSSSSLLLLLLLLCYQLKGQFHFHLFTTVAYRYHDDFFFLMTDLLHAFS